MSCRGLLNLSPLFITFLGLVAPPFAVFEGWDNPAFTLSAQTSSSSAKHPPKPAPTPVLDPGSVSNNVYRNRTLGLSYKIPEGWVLRTDELNAHDDSQPDSQLPTASGQGSKVLLAAFSRPPQAKGEEINSSILIAAEPVLAYPGLKEAVQYLDPISEVAKGQGFTQEEEPYEIAIGAKTLVRADFHKDVGSRVMRQSTLALLAHGYAVSMTVIAGTEDDVEELIDALSFTPSK